MVASVAGGVPVHAERLWVQTTTSAVYLYYRRRTRRGKKKKQGGEEEEEIRRRSSSITPSCWYNDVDIQEESLVVNMSVLLTQCSH